MRDSLSTNLNDLTRLAWIDSGKVEMSVRIENYKREHKYISLFPILAVIDVQ